MRGGWGPFQFPFMPEQASEKALKYDMLFGAITLLVAFFTLIVLALILVLAIRYRKGNKVDRSGKIHHHTGLELTWTIGPLALSLVIFFWSANNFIADRTMPEDAVEIYVIGKQWMWHFEHMDGIRENNELHVPVNTPIKLTMISQDVIHALYLPEMRAQYMVVPGRYTDLQFTPIKPGQYKILCAMLCGTQHSEMVGKLIVLNQRDYADWKEKESNRFQPEVKTMAAAGAILWKDLGCNTCHTDQDNERAPSLVGIFGRKRTFTDGSSVVADRDYIRESILDPYRKINEGYLNTMQAYRDSLTETEVIALQEYIASMTRGEAGEYQREMPETDRGPSHNNDTIDVTNDRPSAGNAQFEMRKDGQ